MLPEGPSAQNAKPGQRVETETALIRVDASKACAAGEQSAWAVISAGQMTSDAPPWDGWVSFEGQRIGVETDNAGLRAVAARIPDGIAVAIYNPGPKPIAICLRTALMPGRFMAERLVFSADGKRVERLQSARGVSEKPGVIPPASGAVYRYVNPMAKASSAYRRAMAGIAALKSVRADQSRRLASALRECPWLLTQASSSIGGSNPSNALASIHRALLIVRHAEALCTNAVGLRRIPRAAGEKIAADLASLEEALAEASMTALDIVPSAQWHRDTNDPVGVCTVTVKARNAGCETVSSLRLWATGEDGCRVEPADAAVFDVLKPGQSAAATFKVTVTGDSSVEKLAGHVAYYRKSAPAHLRLPCQQA